MKADGEIRILFVFVDGLGLGSDRGPLNPLYSGCCPYLAELLDKHSVPVDACLGVPGLPQSATGQTALLTGINAAERLGRHVMGFPNEELKRIIREYNIFSRLRSRGHASAFANGYCLDPWSAAMIKRHSVTTVAALAGIGRVRDKAMLTANQAVAHDLTRERLRPRGYEGPLVSPREAAGHLVQIAAEHSFTLFEVFMTDQLAHRASPGEIAAFLGDLDAFLAELIPALAGAGVEFIMCSDHGNIEDAGTRAHTSNPVPFVALGPRVGPLAAQVRTLTDVVSALLILFPHKTPEENAV